MSKMGQEAAAIMYEDMGEPLVYTENEDEMDMIILAQEEWND